MHEVFSLKPPFPSLFFPLFFRTGQALTRVFIALVIPRYLPPSSICSRWQSEPLRILLIDNSTFFNNPAGYPVLTANHRALITQYMRLRSPPCIVLTGVDPIPGHSSNVTHHDSTSSPVESSMPDALESFVPAPTPAEAQANETRRRSSKISKFKDPLAQLGYLRWFQVNQPPKTKMEIFGPGYQDYLQAPLQPLTDNLESITYEVFEQDPVKYDLYEEAIRKALEEWRDQAKPASGKNRCVVVAVVGAGRGPLVTRALKASAESKVPIELWALEKNPNAFVLLQSHNAQTWDNEVNLVKSDMRSWKGPIAEAGNAQSHTSHYPIDIVVSELLGSFADNELSPECLDGILPLLNPTHGISIPQSYSAWLTPIAAPKLYSDISVRALNDPLATNTPYVVMLHSFDFISTKSHMSAFGPDFVSLPPSEREQRPSLEYAGVTAVEDAMHITKSPVPTVRQAWSFQHGPLIPLPPDSNNSHNVRHARLSFDLRNRAVCHGLAGYFEAVLYDGVELSTNPVNMDQKSPDMMSWFPIFFPLKTPVYAPDHSSLTISMFRATDNRKVWYEWMAEVWSNNPAVAGGSGFRLGVSELGSSKEKGCMM